MMPPDYQAAPARCATCHYKGEYFRMGMDIICLKYGHRGSIDAVCSAYQRPVDEDIKEKGAE